MKKFIYIMIVVIGLMAVIFSFVMQAILTAKYQTDIVLDWCLIGLLGWFTAFYILYNKDF